MENTLIEGLTNKTLQAKIDSLDAKPFLYGKYFPVQKVNAFSWKTLTNQNRARNIAGDLIADNSSIPRKSRPIFQSANGDLPHIGISRELKRSEIKEYQMALAYAGDQNATELVKFWADDAEFCFLGVQSQLEYIALALASNAGVLSFTGENNAAVVSEFDLDYQIGSGQKIHASEDFGNKDNADYIGLFADAVKAGKENNASIKYAFINLDEFYKIQTSEQIIKACANYASSLIGAAQVPSKEDINSTLKRLPHLNGLQLIVIDQDITRELANGDQVTANPFADNRIVFSQTDKLGSTQYDLLNDESQVVTKAVRSHTTVKKYSHPEPLKEVTLGEADALPVFDTAYKNIYAKTDGKDW